MDVGAGECPLERSVSCPTVTAGTILTKIHFLLFFWSESYLVHSQALRDVIVKKENGIHLSCHQGAFGISVIINHGFIRLCAG